MRKFFSELQRRHVYRVGAAYVVVAWLLLQVMNNIAPALNLPNWSITLVLVLLALGFPIVLIFAWIFDLKVVPTAAAAVSDGLPKPKGHLGTKPKVAPAAFASATGKQVIAIAVLPFSNMSGDASQEFFSDGITEEITMVLAKVADLRVVARTSAFEFKGQNQNIRSMGEVLGASHLLEGSVRKAGDRVRITAQLIKAEDGIHLWSEKYDRDLTDVFAVQEDIAQAIAGALRVPLGLKQGEALVPGHALDAQSYQSYLHARALVRGRGPGIGQAIAALEPFTVRNPGFAPAWALLAQAYFLLPSYDPAARSGALEAARQVVQSNYAKADAAARRAITLDARNAAGYIALAAIQTQRGKWAEAEDLLRRALTLDPVEPDALYNLCLMLASVARFQDALTTGETLRTLEPFVPNYNITVAGHLLMDGRSAECSAILESIPPDAAGGYFRAITLAQAYAAQARFDDAANALLAMPHPNVVSRASVETAARLLRHAPAAPGDRAALPLLEGSLNFVYAYAGAAERIMEFPERVHEITGGGTISFIWCPAYAAIRKSERFRAHLRAVGLVAYWQQRGWPERCRALGTADADCD